jgi:hypothetical protein
MKYIRAAEYGTFNERRAVFANPTMSKSQRKHNMNIEKLQAWMDTLLAADSLLAGIGLEA